MDLEVDYIEYGLQTAFAVIAMSMLLMVEPGNHSTYVFMLGLPLLFGHTAFISKSEFNKASLASAIALFYAPISMFMAAMAATIFLCNNFISVFTVSDSFRAHYSSTAIPLIMTGLVIGSGITGYSYLNPSFESEIESKTVETGTQVTMESIEASGLANQNQGNEELESLINMTVASTQAYVVQNYAENAESPETQVLQESFEGAESEIINNLESEGDQPDMEGRVSTMLESLISGKIILIAIPFSIMFLYALQPILGLLTALFGKIFRVIEGRF
ncbi:MAG: hypothetical protein R6V35_05510 [Candidatus Nanohaloarchaea archaeon]